MADAQPRLYSTAAMQTPNHTPRQKVANDVSHLGLERVMVKHLYPEELRPWLLHGTKSEEMSEYGP